jgi:tRNA modification GTPase
MDEGLVVWFPGPASFTGEDVVELHCHGGPVLVDLVLKALLDAGARMAEPGEFSLRAFLNDRMDLAQAEAVADLIEAGTAEAVRAAVNSLRGEFSDRVTALSEAFTELRVYVEAALDFPEEEIDFLGSGEVQRRMEDLVTRFDELAAAARQGALLRDGMTVVLAGRPNVGKSSLLNRLTGLDSAIVTHLPGTTRDVLRERISIDGMPLHVIDTAGLRSDADIVEAEGIRRARREMGVADRVLLVTAADTSGGAGVSEAPELELPDGVPVTVVRNKIDLVGESPGIERLSVKEEKSADTLIRVSALTGEGMEYLQEHLARAMGYQPAQAGLISARRRHLEALDGARRHLEEARIRLVEQGAAELMAEELRLGQQRLGEITGEVSSDDLLGRIFSSFCIGK